MPERNDFLLACFSLLIGLILSSFLLRFLFGTSIYSEYNYYGLFAPSWSVFHVGRADFLDRALSNVIDAFFFGAIIYFIIRGASRVFGEQKYL
ncbi:MAG: hypothetical protein M3362_16345 [Acidobacteriota bacterium]|nr:hypothetical protein [Acidobacteriota bacterium]